MARFSKREALKVLTKQRLIQLSRQFEHSISTAQPKQDHVDTLSKSRRASFDSILSLLSRSVLKAIAEDLVWMLRERPKQIVRRDCRPGRYLPKTPQATYNIEYDRAPKGHRGLQLRHIPSGQLVARKDHLLEVQ